MLLKSIAALFPVADVSIVVAPPRLTAPLISTTPKSVEALSPVPPRTAVAIVPFKVIVPPSIVTSLILPSVVEPSAPILLTETAPDELRVTSVDSPPSVPRISPPKVIPPLPELIVRSAASARVTSPPEAPTANSTASLLVANVTSAPPRAKAAPVNVCAPLVLYSAPPRVIVPVVLGLPNLVMPAPTAESVPILPPNSTPPVWPAVLRLLMSRLARGVPPRPIFPVIFASPEPDKISKSKAPVTAPVIVTAPLEVVVSISVAPLRVTAPVISTVLPVPPV